MSSLMSIHLFMLLTLTCPGIAQKSMTFKTSLRPRGCRKGHSNCLACTKHVVCEVIRFKISHVHGFRYNSVQAGVEPALVSEAALRGGAEAGASAEPVQLAPPLAQDTHHLLAPDARANGTTGEGARPDDMATREADPEEAARADVGPLGGSAPAHRSTALSDSLI